jgi:hypothetical protein
MHHQAIEGLAMSEPTFAAWRDARESSDKGCPWPGPRPLRQDDAALLIGRDHDKMQFRQEVDAHRLVLLTGDSGVGKTSLLDAGLVPELTDAGYTVAVCREWNWASAEHDPVAFLAAKVRTELLPKYPDLTDGAQVFWDLDARLDGKAVLVLDQFEELIRYSPGLTKSVFDLLLDLNHATSIKVVVSFRSEFLHKLRPLENQAMPFTISRYILEEIEPDFALGVVTAPNTEVDEYVTPDTAERIAETWKQAAEQTAEEDAADPFARVGLLHLQALLYSLHAASKGTLIDAALWEANDAGDSPAAVFTKGLRRSIDEKLERCRAAAVEVGVDPFLIEGATQLVARSVKHLSSAGYKLVREARDLAHAALEGELASLSVGAERSGEQSWGVGGDGDLTAEQLDSLIDQLVQSILESDQLVRVDLLESSRSIIAAEVDALSALPPGELSWADRLHPNAVPAIADPIGVSCGPLSGCAPANIVIEELRRFSFALAWLQRSDLVRISTPGGGRVMVSLIHDGFGEALRQWSEDPLKGSVGPLHAITGSSGAVYDRWGTVGTADAHQVHANLSWRGAWIRAQFERVIFVNCDFRGSAFDGCTFSAVTFVNCLLDGVMFSDCTFIGAFDPATGDSKITRPEFVIDLDTGDLPEVIAHYRADGNSGSRLVSPLPGLPAAPMDQVVDRATPLTIEQGGVVIYGGRVSSFIVRSCTSDDSGISLRYVAGSGFEVVEEGTGTYEFFGSSLRHVTFSSATPRDDQTYTITAEGSVLVQVWINENVRGSFDANDCRLVHVWNDSPKVTFSATASPFHGLVNVEIDDPKLSMGAVDSNFTTEQLDNDDEFARSVSATDYRRDPSIDIDDEVAK